MRTPWTVSPGLWRNGMTLPLNLYPPETTSHVGKWKNCTRCAIGQLARKHVFFRGELPADLLFIGEGPGREEDRDGNPFVGRSGRMLDDWIGGASNDWMARGGGRLTVGITNLVLCRPCDSRNGDNRPPDPQEIINCQPRLLEFLGIAKPKAVVLLGYYAHQYMGPLFRPTIPVLELDHPSSYLRSGGNLSPAAERAGRELSAFVLRYLLSN